MVTLVLFIVVLSILVFVHELGHFLFAKWCKMRVDEFAIGFPPRIWSFKKGETVYAINLIPIGGYVKIHGENPDDESLTGKDASRSFSARPKWMQALVLVAGVSFNMIFAWLAIAFGFMVGFPISTDYFPEKQYQDVKVFIGEVRENSAAAEGGLQPGDAIASLAVIGPSMDGPRIGPAKIPTKTEDISNLVSSTEKGEQVLVGYTRGNALSYATLTPQVSTETGKPVIGVSLSAAGIVTLPVHEALIEGAVVTGKMTVAIADGLFTFLAKAITGNAPFSQVSGPVGIARLVGDAGEMGFAYLVSLTALISINLAIINILPFPALDGGRLVLVAIETIIRRPVPHNFANALNTIGFILLLLLMVLVTVNDVIKL
jgi:regulator of sigma E protease